MHTLALAMGKGGTGKTTVAIHLAVGLARQRKRVLLVDLDPTAHATAWLLGLEGIEGKGTAEALLEDRLGAEHLRDVPGRPGLALMPASRSLATAELQLATADGGTFILRRLLAEAADRWDYAILDCPPNLGLYTSSALIASGGILAPLPAGFLSLAGLRLLQESIAKLRKRVPGVAPRLLGCVLFDTDDRKSITAQTRDHLRHEIGDLLYRSEVRVSTAAEALPSRQQTAWDDGADPRGAEDYPAVLRETVARLGR